MDLLSNLLIFNPPEGSIDKNCQLSGVWSLPHPAGDLSVIRWHTVTQGSAWLDMPSGVTYNLIPSMVLFLPQNTAHRLRYQKDEDTHIVCGSLHLPQTARYFLTTLPEVLTLEPNENTAEYFWLRSAITLLQQEANSSQFGSNALCSQQCSTLVTLAIRTWLAQALPEKGLISLLLHPRLGKIISKMLKFPAEPWTVESLAKQANMSRAAFAHLFRQTSGTTPLAVLTTLRLQIATQLLSRRTAPLINIAESIGYATESSFHKAFVRHFGYTPGEYRKRALVLGEKTL